MAERRGHERSVQFVHAFDRLLAIKLATLNASKVMELTSVKRVIQRYEAALGWSASRALVMPMTLRTSIASHAAAIALGAIAVAALLNAHFAEPRSLADYISAICAKSYGSAPAAEAPYLAENASAMTQMMINMGIRPSGDVDTDFVAMMVPHHQGAIEMAQAELRFGRNEQLKRLSQEIIVTQQQEIVAMRMALGQPLPLPAPAPDQVRPAGQNQPDSSRFAP